MAIFATTLSPHQTTFANFARILKLLFSSWKKSLIVLFIGSSLVACDSKVKGDKDTMYVAISTPPQDLDPRRATDAVGMRLTGLMFQSLVKLGPELTIVGEAAESWSYKDKVYTFVLKPNLTFSNGLPITKEDVEYSFAQYLLPTNPFASAYEAIEKVTVETQGERTRVTIKLKKYSATFLVDLSPLKILPAKYTAEKGTEFGRSPLGSGPYVLESWGVNEIIMRRRSDQPEVSTMPRLVFKVVRDDTTRYLKLRKGEVDLVQADLPPSKAAEFKKSDDYIVDQRPGLSVAYLLINHQDKDLSKTLVRRALALAIDRSELITYKLEGLGMPATSILVPADPYFNKDLQWASVNVEKGKALLNEAQLSRKSFILKCSNNSASVENARVIAHQLSKLGIDVTVQSFEWGTYYDDIKKGNFDIATMRWIGISDPDMYRFAFHSREFPPGRNRGRYKNPTLDTLLDQGAELEDLAKRMEHYKKVQKIVFDDVAIIPLWYDLQVAVMQKNVRGYRLPLNGDFSALLQVSKQ
jgi:peptide/nickel transport system substrate-binding protein